MERVVDPVLADMAVEPSRSRVIGYAGLLRALALNAFVASDPATRSLLVISGTAAFGSALLLNALPLMTYFRRGTLAPAHVLQLLPGALLITLPAALLLAVPIALRHRSITRDVMRRHAILAVGFMGLSFVLAGWILPQANQAFRISVSGNPGLQRGANELTVTEVRDKVNDVRTFRGGEGLARRIEYGYYTRFALTVTPAATMLLALALAGSRAGRRYPALSGSLAAIGYLVVVTSARGLVSVLLVQRTTMPPVLLASAIDAASLIAGAAAFYFTAIAAPANPWTTLPPPGSSNERIS